MDIYLNRTLELGQKIPYGACDFHLQISQHTYYVGNPARQGASFPVKIKAAVYCGETEVLNVVAEVQPATKARELGYVFKYEAGVGPEEPDRILAYAGGHLREGPVGALHYRASGAYLEDQDVEVAREHQRKGIATAMYQQAEALSGKQFLSRSGEAMPIDGAALWACPDRPFGVDALYSQPHRLLWVNLADLLPAPLKTLPHVLFDAERFTQSATGQHCIEMANGGAGPRVGLQDARIRGLIGQGHEGKIESFVHDSYAPLKLMRSVQCTAQPPTLALCTGKGLPDNSISPPLAVLSADSREVVLAFVWRHMHAMADLDALELLHPQMKVLDRVRQVRHEHGTPESIERAFELRRTQALSVLTDLVEKEIDFRASQM